jgi:hypothetical protein
VFLCARRDFVAPAILKVEVGLEDRTHGISGQVAASEGPISSSQKEHCSSNTTACASSSLMRVSQAGSSRSQEDLNSIDVSTSSATPRQRFNGSFGMTNDPSLVGNIGVALNQLQASPGVAQLR